MNFSALGRTGLAVSEIGPGQALKGRRAQVVLCSQFGRPAAGPADFGVAALRPAGRYGADGRFGGVRDRWLPDVNARRAALVVQFAALLPPGLPPARGALGYVPAQPQIATVIHGARPPQQVLDDMAASDLQLDARTVDTIPALWQRGIEAEPLPWWTRQGGLRAQLRAALRCRNGLRPVRRRRPRRSVRAWPGT